MSRKNYEVQYFGDWSIVLLYWTKKFHCIGPWVDLVYESLCQFVVDVLSPQLATGTEKAGDFRSKSVSLKLKKRTQLCKGCNFLKAFNPVWFSFGEPANSAQWWIWQWEGLWLWLLALVTRDKLQVISAFFGIGATSHTHQEIQFLPCAEICVKQFTTN